MGVDTTQRMVAMALFGPRELFNKPSVSLGHNDMLAASHMASISQTSNDEKVNGDSTDLPKATEDVHKSLVIDVHINTKRRNQVGVEL
jgi:ascorbate-specific PTS system EIIC-type component UlaA